MFMMVEHIAHDTMPLYFQGVNGPQINVFGYADQPNAEEAPGKLVVEI